VLERGRGRGRKRRGHEVLIVAVIFLLCYLAFAIMIASWERGCGHGRWYIWRKEVTYSRNESRLAALHIFNLEITCCSYTVMHAYPV